jgi:lactate dehydrogenase-like 2-hydroxyacid dehydrogenase
MKIVILDGDTLGKDVSLASLEKRGDLTVYPNTNANEVIERCQNASIIITNKVRLTAKQLENLPDLKLICVAATGTDVIDTDWALKNGILVKNVANYSTASVAQHTFSMLFYLLESLPYYASKTFDASWRDSEIFTCLEKPFWELNQKRWGIIGLGNIGKAVAKRAEAFGCEIVYYSASGTDQKVDYKRMELNELLQTSDVISLHCPLTDKTRSLLNEENLDLIQDHSILINVARGAIIDNEALVKIKQKKKFKVALDVYEQEPLPVDHALYQFRDHPEVLMTPHMAWSSRESRHRLIEGIISNIKETKF